MVDLVNPTKKISGKVDKPKHKQRIQLYFVFI